MTFSPPARGKAGGTMGRQTIAAARGTIRTTPRTPLNPSQIWDPPTGAPSLKTGFR